jgi:ABC-type dipeptide/oligopeptide/nickel transport system ATPase subunit
MILSAENLSFRYGGGEPILSEFDLTLNSQERVGLMAPSGFGKTTLCKLLAGYLSPQTGRVLLDGVPLFPYKGACPVQMIWQHPELVVNPRMTLGRTLHEGGTPSPRILSGLGIHPSWLTRYPRELSGGELQRFCIARVLGPNTRFLLADEITTMLDLVTQAQIWNFLLTETASRGIGLLVVSHSPSLLERVCTRVVDLTKRRA